MVYRRVCKTVVDSVGEAPRLRKDFRQHRSRVLDLRKEGIL